MTLYPKWDYNDYPKTLSETDFWRQVRRTVNGEPVSEEQIDFIVGSIVSGLELKREDNLLDIACGNGALSDRLLPHCSQLVGFDSSEYLIEVANKYFSRPGRARYVRSDVASYVLSERNPETFTKALCYGSFSYFSPADAVLAIEQLSKRFVNISRLYIGNLPDRERAHRFYPANADYAAQLDEHQSQIGIWRSRQQLQELAAHAGWDLEVRYLDSTFYAAHYRFDAVFLRS